MSMLTLVTEMGVIFVLVMIGYYACKRGVLTPEPQKACSWIVVNVCNPCMMLNAAISLEYRMPVSTLLRALLVSGFMFLTLIAAAYIVPSVIRIPPNERYTFKMLSIFGNIGFIGLPVCSAVLGNESLIYVTVGCLLYNLIFYTQGIYILDKARRTFGEGGGDNGKKGFDLRDLLNMGTIGSVAAVFIYLLDPQLPMLVNDVVRYLAEATVFLSMAVLGASLAMSGFKALFGNRRMYLFLLIRMLVLPVFIITVLKQFISDPLVLGSIAIMSSLPGGNLPLMRAKETGLEGSELSQGILLSTAVCIFTIPVVCLFL